MAQAEIYLDMDGVCTDFISAALAAQGYDPATALARWRAEHPGALFPDGVIDKTAKEFFAHECLRQKSFWQGLAAYPWFERLYAELGRRGHVLFLTAPINAPGCVSGKHEWLIGQFGHDFSDFIFTRHKSRLAHGGAFLVDDMPFNVAAFAERKGQGLLFPQIWNEHHSVPDPLEHLLTALDKALAESR